MELNIIIAFQSISNQFFDILFKFFTFLAEPYLMIIIVLFVYWCIEKQKGLLIIYTLITSTLFNNSIKGIVKRPRPVFDINPESENLRILSSETATGFSFPSGHTQNATTFGGIISLIFKKKYITILMSIYILSVGISRIYLGVHYPSDVLFGMIFGVISVSICSFLYKKMKNKIMLFFITTLCFIPFLFIFYNIPLGEFDVMDFYKSFGMMSGFSVGYIIENKFINFETTFKSKKNLIFRMIIGIIIIGIFYFAMKLLFPINYLFAMLRYFLIAFLGIAGCPFVFKIMKI